MEIITNMHESNPLLKIMWDSVLWTLHNILSSHDKHYCTNDYTCIQNNLLSEGYVYLHFSKCVGVGLSSTLHEDSIRISSEKINMLDLNIHHFNEIFFLLNATVYK